MKNASSPSNLLRWFDPRSRSVSTWAFILNRITALGLTLYLFLHLIRLGTLVRGPEAYAAFLEIAHTPVVKVGEMLVITAGLMHGLNGIRIALTSFGIGGTRQREMLVVVALLSAAGIIWFGYKMFGPGA